MRADPIAPSGVRPWELIREAEFAGITRPNNTKETPSEILAWNG